MCSLSNACAVGTVSCATGTATCVVGSFQPAGTVCGTTTCPYDTLLTPICDGKGHCSDTDETPCPSGMCRQDGLSCQGPTPL
jgi:hypothetical protein